jgi:nucleotide-binding universal stress UspA family protein
MPHDKIRRILVGLELGPRASRVTAGSQCAAEEAVWLARRVGAEVVFLHSTFGDEVFDPLTSSAAIVSLGATPEGQKALEGVADRARDQGVSATLEYSDERPVFALTRRVLKGDVDLLVIGKRNEPGEDGRRLGSIATKLLRKCPGPVWVVPPIPGVDPGPILAATALDAVGADALRVGAWLARQREVALHVVHAYQMPFELIHEAARVPQAEHRQHLEQLRDKARGAVQAQLEGVEPPPTVELHVGCTSPERGILAAIELVRPSLLVMGTVSKGGIAGLLIGHTAERLLPRLDCSILTVKPDDFVSPIQP